MRDSKKRGERTTGSRMMNFYERACVRYAACVAELQASAGRGDFEQQLAKAAAAREHCATARARAAAYLRNGRTGTRCCIYR